MNTFSQFTNCRHSVGRMTTRWLVVSLLGIGVFQDAPAWAQNAKNSETEKSDSAQPSKKVDRKTIDLGKFNMRELRPIRNQTMEVSFAVHLAWSDSVDEKLAARLEHWRHRLRQQVIICIRTSDPTVLLEPSLAKLRRKIFLRVNRTLKSVIVEEVLFSSFSFSAS